MHASQAPEISDRSVAQAEGALQAPLDQGCAGRSCADGGDCGGDRGYGREAPARRAQVYPVAQERLQSERLQGRDRAVDGVLPGHAGWARTQHRGGRCTLQDERGICDAQNSCAHVELQFASSGGDSHRHRGEGGDGRSDQGAAGADRARRTGRNSHECAHGLRAHAATRADGPVYVFGRARVYCPQSLGSGADHRQRRVGGREVLSSASGCPTLGGFYQCRP